LVIYGGTVEKTNIGEQLIFKQLQDQQHQLRRIDERLRHIEISIGILKTKAAIIGTFFA